jgi:predicted ribosomally synthesized peptide with nif11-like leader
MLRLSISGNLRGEHQLSGPIVTSKLRQPGGYWKCLHLGVLCLKLKWVVGGSDVRYKLHREHTARSNRCMRAEAGTRVERTVNQLLAAATPERGRIFMSQESALAFRDAVASNSDLQKQVKDVLTEGAPDALAALGKEHGFDFSAADAEDVLNSLGSGERELSDFELDMVAGGSTLSVLVDVGGGGGGGGS